MPLIKQNVYLIKDISLLSSVFYVYQTFSACLYYHCHNSPWIAKVYFKYSFFTLTFIFLVHFINCTFYTHVNSLCPADPTLAPSRPVFNLVQIQHRNINHRNFQHNKKRPENPTNLPRNSCLVFTKKKKKTSFCQPSDHQSPTKISRRKLLKLCKLLLAFVLIFPYFLLF